MAADDDDAARAEALDSIGAERAGTVGIPAELARLHAQVADLEARVAALEAPA